MSFRPSKGAAISPLPAAVAAAFAAAEFGGGSRSTTTAAGIPFSAIEWGDADGRPLVLVHGIAASARVWWRLGPALAATGRRVVAIDQAGHGLTGHWLGHHRFRDNAADLAEWFRASGLDRPDVQVVGHSWGGLTVAALPRSGIRPATLVLLDPPVLPAAVIAQMVDDPSEQPYPTVEAGIVAVAAVNPSWPTQDVRAKAEALTQADSDAVRAVLLENGDFDGGLADLVDPSTDGLDIWLIRGDPATGGLIPDQVLPAFAARLGADHVITLAGAPHSPQRTDAAATTAAILAALG
jgi:pimeloyl-ACP methyl ester carboxylesterase